MILILLIAIFNFSVFAIDYPTKPVEIIVAYSAGGSTDVTAGLVAAGLEYDLCFFISIIIFFKL